MKCPNCKGPIKNKACANCGVLKYPTGILELDYEWAKTLEAEKPIEFTFSSSHPFPIVSGNYHWIIANVPTATFTWNDRT